MVMKILKGLGAAISPGVRRGGTRRGSGSRYYRRNKKDGTVSAVSEQTLAKRGAAAAGAGAAGAGLGVVGSGTLCVPSLARFVVLPAIAGDGFIDAVNS